MCAIITVQNKGESPQRRKKMKHKRVFRFDLIDLYEDSEGELVFSSDDMEEIKKAAKKYIEKETDGECELAIADWDTREIKRL